MMWLSGFQSADELPNAGMYLRGETNVSKSLRKAVEYLKMNEMSIHLDYDAAFGGIAALASKAMLSRLSGDRGFIVFPLI